MIYNVAPGQTVKMQTTYDSVALGCNKLAVSVYEFQKARTTGWLYNWSPPCSLFNNPDKLYRFSIEPDQPITRDNRYKIVKVV